MNKAICLLLLCILPFCHGILDYIVNKKAFDNGLYRALSCGGVAGGYATLQEMTGSAPGRVWDFNSDGTIKESNSNVNLCLDVFRSRFEANYPVGEWTCNGQANQKWQFDGSAGNWGAIHPVGYPNLCLDAHFGSTDIGTSVILYTCNNQTNQLWNRFSSG